MNELKIDIITGEFDDSHQDCVICETCGTEMIPHPMQYMVDYRCYKARWYYPFGHFNRAFLYEIYEEPAQLCQLVERGELIN